jgi:hypothetical protein
MERCVCGVEDACANVEFLQHGILSRVLDDGDGDKFFEFVSFGVVGNAECCKYEFARFRSC